MPMDLPLIPSTPTHGQLRANDLAKQEDARVAQEFEAVFLTQAVDEMLKTVKIGSLGGGLADETWRSFLAKSIADEISQTGITSISGGVTKAIGAYRDLQMMNNGQPGE